MDGCAGQHGPHYLELKFGKFALCGVSPAHLPSVGMFQLHLRSFYSHLSSLTTKMIEPDEIHPQRGPQEIEELPPSVNVYHYKGMDDFCRVLSLELNRLHSSFRTAPNTGAPPTGGNCEGRQDDLITLPQSEVTQSDHIIFIIEPLAFEHDFLNSLEHPSVRGRISFNPRTNILVVKMILPTHEQAARAFDDMLKLALQPMGLYRVIHTWGATTLTAPDGTRKEADGGWGPRRHPRGAPKKPAVVLEVASSETPGKLRRDCHYWVDPSRGEASMAIGVKIHAQKPQISIEQWEWSSESSRPTKKAHLTIAKSDSKIHFDPDQPLTQLIIPFHIVFRRPAESGRERDIVFAKQELIEFANVVWDMQFESEQE
jgi:hypothetical protein